MKHFARRMKHYVEFGEGGLAVFSNLPSQIREYSPGQQIVDFGETVDEIFIVESGWATRARFLQDGRRQIINFMLPGDYFDLMAIVGAESDHVVTAATSVTIRSFDGREFLKAVQSSSVLASAFWWVTVQEEAILRQQIVRVGRLSAKERVANFILELNRRQTISDGTPSDFVPLPVPQAMLADALGLSIVHVSRTLTSLKAQSLIQTNRRGISIENRRALMDVAEFDVLHLSPQRLQLAAQ